MHHSNGKTLLLFGLLILILFSSFQSAFAQESADQKRVLILCADELKFPAYKLFINGFEERMNQLGVNSLNYSYEYLEWTRHSSDRSYPAKVVAYLQGKYVHPKPDLVIVLGGQIAQFFSDRSQDLFPQVPVIFAGNTLSAPNPPQIPATSTTLLASYDIKKAIEVILKIQPKTNKIHLIYGDSEPERSLQAQDFRVLQSVGNQVEFIYLTKLTVAQLLENVRSIEGDSVILLRSLFQDVSGNSFVPADVARRVSQDSRVPVYGSSDSFVGTGVLGGYVGSNRLMGARAAEMGIKILEGKIDATTHRDAIENAEYLFDWRAMQRWDIREELLPPERRIAHREADMWQMYKWYILSGSGLLLLQSILIFAWLINRAKRKWAERKLQENQADLDKERLRIKLLTAGLETSSNIVVVLDAQRNIWWANEAFESLSGFSPEEIVGKDAKILLSSNNHQEMLEQLKDSFISQSEWRGELIARHKDGSTYVDEVIVTPILGEDKTASYFLIVGRDITEKVKAREAIRAAQEAQIKAEKIFSIGTMAAGISHEINQPLNSIKVISGGILYLLAQGEKLQAEEFNESIKEISNQTDRISNIIKHLRSFFRRDETHLVPCDINASVEMAFELVGKQIADHGVIGHKDLQKNLPQVMASPTGLEEIIVNLLVNALQALDTVDGIDKTITVRTYFAENVILEVSDNGPGIDPSLKKKIFETFVSTKPQSENLGLGLAIVNNIVHSYFGTIQVSSNERAGATFTVSLPVVQNVEEEAGNENVAD